LSKLLAPSLVAALLLSSVAAAADDRPVLSGRVIRVKDGDSFLMLSRGEEVEARIAGIDAPELSQPYGEAAREALRRRVDGREVRVEVGTIDRYGRAVGRLREGSDDVGRELVREGAAWVSRRYADDLELYDLESEARRARRGLWATAEAERMPPWNWRRSHPRSSAAPAEVEPRGDPAACGTKRYCREMTSCEEARFHLTRCGLLRLDGDGDGVPCEELCQGPKP
jgi:endonuclease YncB( thermonuclease family)